MEIVANKIWSAKWHLAAIDRDDLLKLGFISIITGFVFVMYHLLGNTVENVHSRSAFVWMVSRWNDRISFGGADYSHGYVIPFVSLAVIWVRRKDLARAPVAVCKWGLAVVVTALVMHWIGARMQQTRVSLMSMIVLLWGLPLYFFGWQVARHLIFPCAFLFFCIPLNFLDTIAFPLRLHMTVISSWLLNTMGIASERAGTAIICSHGTFSLDVADPCSGLRSLLAMTAITAVYAYFTQKTLIRQWLLFLCAIPLAVIGNVGRITTVAVSARAFGSDFAMLVHDYSGFIVFAVGIICMIGIGGLLNINYREAYQVWKRKLFSPS